MSRILEGGQGFIRQKPLETPLEAATVRREAVSVLEATSPQVFRVVWRGVPLGERGEVVTFCRSDLQGLLLSHSRLCGSCFPIWLWAGLCPSAWGGGGGCSVSSASPVCVPIRILWIELYFLRWHCLLSHMGNSVMTGCDPPPPPYLILISPALHFAINDSSQQNSFQHAIDSLV